MLLCDVASCGTCVSFLWLYVVLCFVFFFFFKQKTAYEMRISDWSSDVCSSDLIKNKSAANSTIFLVCRPREIAAADAAENYWEDVEPLVAEAVRRRVAKFQEAGIGGVDLYLASFGPALEEFSRHWPLKRGTPRPPPEERKRRRQTELDRK